MIFKHYVFHLMNLFSLTILMVLIGFGSGIEAQERLLVMFGQPSPSISRADQGQQISLEDQDNGLALETFYLLPQALRGLAGLHLIEQQHTNNGIPRGRRLSLFKVPNPPGGWEDRVAFFDFDEQGILEIFQVNQNPEGWFPLSKVKSESLSADQRFFVGLLEPLVKQAHLLNKPLKIEQSLVAPRGLLSPQMVRPVYDYLKESPNTHSSQIVLRALRTYDREGKLAQTSVSVERISIGPKDQALGFLF